jgi:hypothetical protein
MTVVRIASAEHDAFGRFVDAVFALSDDPGPVSVVRYLAASRGLEESRRSGPTPPHSRRSTKTSSAGRRSIRPAA